MSAITLGIGEYGVFKSPGDVIQTHALGSCIAIIILDPTTRSVGMAHVALPDSKAGPARAQKLPGYFADTGVPALLEEMKEAGCATNLRSLVVKLAGGARVMDKNDTFDVGKRNALAIKEALRQQRMGVVAEDVGGTISRTVTVHVGDGKVRVTSPGREPATV